LPHARLTGRAGNPQMIIGAGCTPVRGDFINAKSCKIFLILPSHIDVICMFLQVFWIRTITWQWIELKVETYFREV
jgi:hypothetical protein